MGGYGEFLRQRTDLTLGWKRGPAFHLDKGLRIAAASHPTSSHLNPGPVSVFLAYVESVLLRNPLSLEQVSHNEGCLLRCLLCWAGDGEVLGQSNEG